jgi:putative ABC transport system permease protein
VYQFAITIALISFTWIAYRQVQFMMQKELGLNIEGTLVVWGPMGLKWNESFPKRMQSFEEEIKQLPQVKGAASSKNVPGDRLSKEYNVKIKGDNNQYALNTTWVGNNFFDVYGMQLLAGRDFTSQNPNAGQLMLNESAVKLMGYTSEEIIGKKLIIWGKESEVVGVVNDHHQQSLHALIEPIMFRNGYGQDGYFSIKVSGNNLRETVAGVKSKYNEFFQGASFEFFFLEGHFNAQYQNEYILNTVIGVFSGLAILISCMGLWGLALHSVNTRTKEIGIRKVLGASVSSITLLLSKDFVRLVLIAFVIAAPIAWFVIQQWLLDFAYRIPLNATAFIISGVLTLIIALFTVSYQSIKAALVNPVKSLRNE